METRIHQLNTNQAVAKPAPKTEESRKAEPEKEKANTDVFVRTNASESQAVTYTNKPTLDELRAMEEKRISAFREMLERMLAKQGEAYNLVLFGEKYNVTAEDSEKAASSIADGGEYSVDAVAGRILDMAKALSGGDSSKISVLRDAVEKGFREAAKAFGKQMPDITQRTYDEVMKRFDEWEKEGK